MRAWWQRTALVLVAPRPVFVALRDEDADDVSARSEPVLLIVLLAGMAFVLSTRTAAHLLDDNDYDGLLVAVWTFLAGSLYGAVAFWGLGALLHGSVTALGSQGSYRRSRHLLAFAAVPVALSLALWPFKLGIYGADLFHRGGADAGVGGKVFEGLGLSFAAWSLGLLVVGVRSVHGWTWRRSLVGASAPFVASAAVTVLLSGLHSGH